MEKKTKLIIAGLVAVIAILAAIIINGYYTGWMATQQQAAYMIGYQQAILDVIQQSRNCQTGVPLRAGNQTFTLIDIECLQLAGNTTG